MASLLISGASRGIGRALAVELSTRGRDVIATAGNPSDLDDLPAVQRIQLDVTDQASGDAAIAAVGPVDVLAANAGVIYTSSVEALPVEDLESVFALNIGGTLRVTQALLRGMRERRHGRIVVVSSLLGRIAVPMRAVYASTKWAPEALGENPGDGGHGGRHDGDHGGAGRGGHRWTHQPQEHDRRSRYLAAIEAHDRAPRDVPFNVTELAAGAER